MWTENFFNSCQIVKHFNIKLLFSQRIKKGMARQGINKNRNAGIAKGWAWVWVVDKRKKSSCKRSVWQTVRITTEQAGSAEHRCNGLWFPILSLLLGWWWWCWWLCLACWLWLPAIEANNRNEEVKIINSPYIALL